MTHGLVMLTAAWGTTLNGWVICYAWSLFIYGIGVCKSLQLIFPRHLSLTNEQEESTQ